MKRKLSRVMGRLLEKRLEEVLRREIKDPKYMPQCDFETCGDRAKAIVDAALPDVYKLMEMAIINHRVKVHDEPELLPELDVLEKESEPEIVVLARSSWWNR